MKSYKVYMHIFPNGKRYIGSTCCALETRWNNGKGYRNHDKVYDAICKFGWDNVHHYLLFDELSKDEALNIENALIYKFQTHKKTFGYNTRVSPLPNDFILPAYKKKRIHCKPTYKLVPQEKLTRLYLRKPVQIVETGEVFESITYAARCFMVNKTAICCALRNPNYTSCGYHWQYLNESEKL